MNRRGFLKFLGVTPAVAAAPAIAKVLPAVPTQAIAPAIDPAMRNLLVEALEKMVNPPMIVDTKAVLADVLPSLYPGAVSWIDPAYAEQYAFEFVRSIGPVLR